MYTAVIIDDEKWVVKSLQFVLKNQDYFEVIGEAYNGPTGLDLILEKKPDLAFVDIKMPGMGGLELLQAANSEKAETIFIIISGHAEFAYVQKAMSQNAIGYCLKPFSSTEIQEGLQRAYERVHTKYLLKEKQMEEDEQVDFSTNNRIVKSMLHYIHDNYCTNISIQQIADHCSINSNYASQLFNKIIGQTYNSYLTDLRLKQAVKLLQNTDLAVAEIASEVGYRDYFYFAKVFKKSMGITPTSFRNGGENE